MASIHPSLVATAPPPHRNPLARSISDAFRHQAEALQAFSNSNDGSSVDQLAGVTGDSLAREEGIDHEQHLVVSPYTSKGHLLDLSSLALPYQLLARSLMVMQAIRSDYATAQYVEAFNWSAVVEKLKDLLEMEKSFRWQEHSFYIVVFKSQIPNTTERSHLGNLDKIAHAEAMASGGLLKYWFGIPDASGRNLATCVWRNPQDAQLGSVGEGHRQAAKEARTLFTEWRIERLKLVIGPDALSWKIIEWS